MLHFLQGEIYLICALITALILLWQSRDKIASTPDLMLKKCTLGFCLCFICGAARGLFLPDELDRYTYGLEFLLFAPSIYFWIGYAETLLGRSTFDGRKHMSFTLIPLLPALALAIAGLFAPVLFSLDEKYRLTFTFWGYAYFVYLFLWSLPGMIGLMKQGQYEAEPAQKSTLYVTALLPLCLPLKMLVCTNIEKDAPFVCAVISLIQLGYCMGRTRRQISLDALTQVNNRHNLMGFMNYKLKNNSGDMCLMMIDIDDFKHINDTCGHLEGDRALTLTASALKRACGPFPRRPYIGHYGGDEFIIVMDGSLADAERLKDDIEKNLGDSLVCGAQPIRLSIGIAAYDQRYSAKDWINSADKQLYESKSKNKNKANAQNATGKY